MPGEVTGGGTGLLSYIGGKWAGSLFNSWKDRGKNWPTTNLRQVAPAPPAPRAPVVPQLPTVEAVTYPTQGQPQRGTPRKGKAKKRKRNDLWQAGIDAMLSNAAAVAFPGGLPASARPVTRSPRAIAQSRPPLLSRQRGSVGPAPSRAERMLDESELDRLLARPLRSQSPITRTRAVPPGGSSSSSSSTPGDLDPVQVTAKKVGTNASARSGAGTAAKNVAYPGSGPGAASAGTRGKPGSAPGSTGRAAPKSRIPGTSRSTARAPVVSLDALLNPLLKSLTKRTTSQRPSFSVVGPGPSSPAAGPRSTPAAYAPMTQTWFQRDAGEPCKCTGTRNKGKPRQPRSVCYRGTYIETAKGLKKVRREQVPC